MPDLLAPASAEKPSRSRSRQRARTDAHEHRSSMWDPLKKIGSWLRREEEEPPPPAKLDEEDKENGRPKSSGDRPGRPSGLLNRRASRKVIPGLPRPPTFKRMNSEKRDKLLPVPVEGERRAASADRRGSRLGLRRTLSPPPVNMSALSAPDIMSPHNSDDRQKSPPTIGGAPDSNIPAGARQVDYNMEESIDYMSAGEPLPLSIADDYYEKESLRSASDIDEIRLQEELEAKWILNLSMHFRDLSDREKFFVTFAEEPNMWRRVTVSCDYRELTPDSLEADLKSLHYQRDKSARIYEAIRDSLPDIQFYSTVTNLKLQTADGRLHVHVTEDVNEIIPYPSLSAVEHLSCKRFKESDVSFDSHISGFVYKVSVNRRTYIKKEIPGPDAVEEFLYEINALCSLKDSKSVIQFEGIIVDEKSELIKGLLISYAEQGALVDLLYDFKNTDHMSWARRERWARQIVEGLSEIHEAGFVQGDFTLSNIVIDYHDNAKIIDINRRGCPVGWEPPELARLIESGQRISIYIGVKSDLFQLGMVMWALAEQQDEPERQDRPLVKSFDRYNSTPEYFRDIIRACLSDNPKGRPTAKNLLSMFPDLSSSQPKIIENETSRRSISPHRPDKQYIDPATAVDLSDIPSRNRSRSPFSNLQMPSTEYLDSSGSYILPSSHTHPRGRSPAQNHLTSNRANNPSSETGPGTRRSEYSPYPGPGPRSIMSLDDIDSEIDIEHELASLPASRETRWEQVYIDENTKFVQRGGGEVGIDGAGFEGKERGDKGDVWVTTPTGEVAGEFERERDTNHIAPLFDVSAKKEGMPPQMPPPPSPPEHGVDAEEDPAASNSDIAAMVRREPSTKASFADRIHHPTPLDNPDVTHTLTDLEHEIEALDTSFISSSAMSSSAVSSSAVDRNMASSNMAPSRVGTGFSLASSRVAPSRVGTGFSFSPPLHQDSGFAEGRVSFESVGIRKSLDDQRMEGICEGRVEGMMWGGGDCFEGVGVGGSELLGRDDDEGRVDVGKVAQRRMTEVKEEKALEEKGSCNTIRPPSLTIPHFYHGTPKMMEEGPTTATQEIANPNEAGFSEKREERYLPERFHQDLGGNFSEKNDVLEEKAVLRHTVGAIQSLEFGGGAMV